MNGPTIDEKMDAVRRYILMLVDDRKKLKEKLAENRQDLESAKVMLKRYLDKKEAEA